MDDTLSLSLPMPGANQLRILSPAYLDLILINSKRPDPARVDSWDFVTTSSQFQSPPLDDLVVLADGQPITLQSAGFKRRPLYAPLQKRDLRIENHLILSLASPIADGQSVEVLNLSGLLWPTNLQFKAVADPFRYSPAIHVNQVGYLPGLPKTAIVGYYLGSLGELNISDSAGFKLIDYKTGAVVFEGTLKPRTDTGYLYYPKPYQYVWEADFSNFATPGEYRLMVPGLGTSGPFLIEEGVAMAFARAYALGLYHQRCGMANELPYTRFTHGPCHTLPAEFPNASYTIAQKLLADATANYASNPRHTAPRLKDFNSSLYPFVNKGRVDVSGGHHDAGDYSKYTINSAHLIHTLVFAVDAFPGVQELDNLGIPESGDGISDLLEEAKWEADFLAKMQDADGGFYYLVYPRARAYESDVLPDRGDPQIVWPKNTAATAAAVAALAQCASSPAFKKNFPDAAKTYLDKAQLGWNFLTNAIAKFGKDGSYQQLISYGNEFMHDDELAWAACELFLATGEPDYHQKLREWFDPSNPNTFRWSWWRMFEGYGDAIRSYAFAVQTGRRQTNELDLLFLAKCERQIRLAGADVLTRSISNAYGTSFPLETKRVRTAGWYFSVDQAFDLAVASLLSSDTGMMRGFLYNLNFEAGCNPVNVCYVTGLGWKRQREIVHQYAQNDRRILPPTGIPLGNIQDQFQYLTPYGGELGKLTYPLDGAASAPYPYYDRWADSFNVTTEFTIFNEARSLASLALLASQTYLKKQVWKPSIARITGLPVEVGTNTPVTATLDLTGLRAEDARVVWEAKNQEPAFGNSFTFASTNYGVNWVEAEAQWPDGRRVFAVSEFTATNGLPVVSVVATVPKASEAGPTPGTFTFSRKGNMQSAITIRFLLAGTATKWEDYRAPNGTVPDTVTIAAGATNTSLVLIPIDDSNYEGTETIKLTLSLDKTYNVGSPSEAVIVIEDNDPPPDKPIIKGQPASQEAMLGVDVVFRVVATGTTPLTYQWRYSGVDLPGANADSLTLKNVQPGNAGDYSVVVSNGATSVTSAPAVLTIKTSYPRSRKPPTISPIPNQKTTMNTPWLVIPVVVDSDSTPPYKLSTSAHSSNTILVSDENILFNISTLERNMIVVPSANQSGFANITVTVSDDENLLASTSFTLEVNPPERDFPNLRLETLGEQVLLLWSTNAIDFMIQTAENLQDPMDWLPLAATPMIVGDRFLVTLQKSTQGQFFRLKKNTAN